MPVLRTPGERFAGLPDFPYPPRYADAGGLRMAYVEAGPPDGEPVLLLHGEPSWSFLYRTVIGVLAEAGLRAIAADLVGFGRAGVRAMPLLVPTAPDDPATAANQAAWQRLREWDKPFLVAFSDRDPITGGMAPVLKRAVPGTVGIDHPVLEGAGHFLQEDAGERLGTVIADFVRGNPAFP